MPAQRPALPRLVEQLRILLWLQMYCTLGVLLALFVAIGLGPSSADAGDSLINRAFAEMGSLIVAATLLAVSASQLWRGRPWTYVLTVLAQLVVVADIVQGFALGLVVTLSVILYLLVTAWVVVDVCRGEVRGYAFRPRHSGGTA